MRKDTKIYVDLDGVLADFFAEWAKLSPKPVAHWKQMPVPLRDDTLSKMIGTDFFNRIPKFNTADTLIQYITDMFGSYNILSAPLRYDAKNSEHWKRTWVKRELKIQPKEMIVNSNKEKWAVNEDGTPNILIDDRVPNLDRWIAAGGIGIRYQANEDFISSVIIELEKHLA